MSISFPKTKTPRRFSLPVGKVANLRGARLQAFIEQTDQHCRADRDNPLLPKIAASCRFEGKPMIKEIDRRCQETASVFHFLLPAPARI
jgi:hypothetical protein